MLTPIATVASNPRPHERSADADVLWGKRELLAGLPPWQGGGNMIADKRFEKTVSQPNPNKREADHIARP